MKEKVMKNVLGTVWAKNNWSVHKLRMEICKVIESGKAQVMADIREDGTQLFTVIADGRIQSKWAITMADLRHKSF